MEIGAQASPPERSAKKGRRAAALFRDEKQNPAFGDVR
jgi:hypothetical protein